MQALNVLHSGVCPTYVGMNRVVGDAVVVDLCMPHVCGDEPNLEWFESDKFEYAPRMWG